MINHCNEKMILKGVEFLQVKVITIVKIMVI